MAKIDSYQGVKVFLAKKARKDKKNPDAPAEKLSKLGKIHMAVFAPNGRQLVGFMVVRPDVAGMVKREDAFLAWDSFEPCERGVKVTRPEDGLDDAARKRLGLDWDKCIMWAGMDARTRSGKVMGYVNDVEFDAKTGRAKTFFVGDGGASRMLVGSFEIPAEMVIGYSPKDQFMVVSDEAEKLAVDGGAAAKAGEAWASAKVKGAEMGHKAGAAASEAVDKGSFALGRALGKAKRAISDATAEEPQPADPAEIPAANVSVSAPVETLPASEEDRAAAGEPVTYVPAAQKPAAQQPADPKAKAPSSAAKPAAKKPMEAQKAAAKKKAAQASTDAARMVGKGLGRMGKMFGSFKEEFDKASK